MNIGIVTQWFASGAGHVARAYADVLSHGHSVSIYARGGRVTRGDSAWDRPNVTWAPRHPHATGIHAGHFARWARRHRIEAVLFNEQRQWRGVVLARRLGLLSGAYVDYYTQDTVPFFGLYDFLVCNTRRHFSAFDWHPCCRLVPWGTQPELFRPPPQRVERPLTFLISAGWDGAYARNAAWMDRRGAGLAMRALRQVSGSCRLLVYSQTPLADCPPAWQESVAADPRIAFRVGTYQPFPYHEGDVYVYPSRLDGIGLTLPEALSSGLPAITTDCAPMNEFVRHGENGWLVPVAEYRGRPDGYYWPESLCGEQALASALQAYVDRPALAADQGRSARARAEQELSWERNAAGLGDWMAAQRPRGEDQSALERRSLSYDRSHAPTPWQQVLVGSYAFLQYWRSGGNR